MVDKCPKCKETLTTRTINKELGQGSIFIPIAEICPKCNWSKDLTGAGDIVAKPSVIEEAGTKVKETPIVKSAHVEPSLEPSPAKVPSKPIDLNRFLSVGLVIIVLLGIAWAFYPKATENPVTTIPEPSPTPVITVIPVITEQMPVPVSEVTPTGKKVQVKIDKDRGFMDASQKNLKIRLGDEIAWTNDNSYRITLISKEGLFKDEVIDYGYRMNYVFKKEGMFNFDLKVGDIVKFNGTVQVEP